MAASSGRRSGLHESAAAPLRPSAASYPHSPQQQQQKDGQRQQRTDEHPRQQQTEIQQEQQDTSERQHLQQDVMCEMKRQEKDEQQEGDSNEKLQQQPAKDQRQQDNNTERRLKPTEQQQQQAEANDALQHQNKREDTTLCLGCALQFLTYLPIEEKAAAAAVAGVSDLSLLPPAESLAAAAAAGHSVADTLDSARPAAAAAVEGGPAAAGGSVVGGDGTEAVLFFRRVDASLLQPRCEEALRAAAAAAGGRERSASGDGAVIYPDAAARVEAELLLLAAASEAAEKGVKLTQRQQQDMLLNHLMQLAATRRETFAAGQQQQQTFPLLLADTHPLQKDPRAALCVSETLRFVLSFHSSCCFCFSQVDDVSASRISGATAAAVAGRPSRLSPAAARLAAAAWRYGGRECGSDASAAATAAGGGGGRQKGAAAATSSSTAAVWRVTSGVRWQDLPAETVNEDKDKKLRRRAISLRRCLVRATNPWRSKSKWKETDKPAAEAQLSWERSLLAETETEQQQQQQEQQQHLLQAREVAQVRNGRARGLLHLKRLQQTQKKQQPQQLQEQDQQQLRQHEETGRVERCMSALQNCRIAVPGATLHAEETDEAQPGDAAAAQRKGVRFALASSALLVKNRQPMLGGSRGAVSAAADSKEIQQGERERTTEEADAQSTAFYSAAANRNEMEDQRQGLHRNKNPFLLRHRSFRRATAAGGRTRTGGRRSAEEASIRDSEGAGSVAAILEPAASGEGGAEGRQNTQGTDEAAAGGSEAVLFASCPGTKAERDAVAAAASPAPVAAGAPAGAAATSLLVAAPYNLSPTLHQKAKSFMGRSLWDAFGVVDGPATAAAGGAAAAALAPSFLLLQEQEWLPPPVARGRGRLAAAVKAEDGSAAAEYAPPVAASKKKKPRGVSYAQYLFPSRFEYDPHALDDKRFQQGRHQTVLRMQACSTSVLPYYPPLLLKDELNRQFHKRQLIRLTFMQLSASFAAAPPDRPPFRDALKTAIDLLQINTVRLFLVAAPYIRSRNLRKKIFGLLEQEKQLDVSTVACAWVYFERLVLLGAVQKNCRKLYAGACLLLAFKFNQSGEAAIVRSIGKLLKQLDKGASAHPLCLAEFTVYCLLEFSLQLSIHHVLPLILNYLEDRDETFEDVYGSPETAFFSI